MKYLSLFFGAGGGDLAFQHLLNDFKCIGYIDNETYCQRVIKQRQKDGLLDKAPIYGDIRTFIDSGCAELYRGITDVITAGFPCQPFSVAGKRQGEQDERNLWPQTIATIRLVRPRYAFLENVPGLLVSGYMPRIFADLAKAGYDARWTVLGADDVGALHRRKRLWILANSAKNPRNIRSELESNGWAEEAKQIGLGSQDVADTKIQRFQKSKKSESQTRKSRNRLELQSFYTGRQAGGWSTEPALGRMAHGVANRVDRFKAIGNGQVPQVAALAWKILKTT